MQFVVERRTQSNKTLHAIRCSHSSWVAFPSIFSNHMTLHGQESSMTTKWMNERTNQEKKDEKFEVEGKKAVAFTFNPAYLCE